VDRSVSESEKPEFGFGALPCVCVSGVLQPPAKAADDRSNIVADAMAKVFMAAFLVRGTRHPIERTLPQVKRFNRNLRMFCPQLHITMCSHLLSCGSIDAAGSEFRLAIKWNANSLSKPKTRYDSATAGFELVRYSYSGQ
jgi:hypothetical protein